MRWFYVSIVCFLVVLFNQTVLTFAIPDSVRSGRVFWLTLFATDVILIVAAFVTMALALFLAPRKERKDPPDAEGPPR